MESHSPSFVSTDLKVFKVRWIQKLKVYKTHARYFIVGSNISETTYRILKIDRTDPWELVIIDDGVDYSSVEISATLQCLHLGNITSSKKEGFVEEYTAHGIVGFVRFLEGYYMIIITKQSKVAEICGHSIYKIEDTAMFYIPNESVAVTDQDELRYLKMFQTVDFSSDFYFSYSYELSNSLQHNLVMLQNTADTTEMPEACLKSRKSRIVSPCDRFLWNKFLLQTSLSQPISTLWTLNIIHGHVSQSCINVYGKHIYITLIGRRSSSYAGTRFIKRGCNVNGDVANEVETEQIVHCSSTSSLHHTSLTSYVQHRGSVPVHWQQDISANVVPSKPPINISTNNPYAQSTAKHFCQLMERFGTPLVVLNLVRNKERRHRESVLGNQYKCAVDYLNQFLKTEQRIKYYALDMAHLSRGVKADVLAKLASVAEHSLQATGFFRSKPDLFLETLNKNLKWKEIKVQRLGGYCVQTGVLRTNCVDCLDRTNSAQFVAGKCALAYQLFSLGVLSEPELEFDTDVMRLYEEMFEAHGDIIALQYGGSQLVHTIQSYRRTAAPWASHSRDIVTTLSRYYTNTFSDADKQCAINLFLGVFRPNAIKEPLWDIPTDHYLHNNDLQVLLSFSSSTYTRWFNPALLNNELFPFQMTQTLRDCSEFDEERCHLSRSDSLNHCKNCVDWYNDLHNPSKLTVFEECFALNITDTLSRCISAGYSDYSPFTTRSENWQQLKHKHLQANTSTSQTSVDASSNESSESEDAASPATSDLFRTDNFIKLDKPSKTMAWMASPTLKDFSAKTVYGIDLENAATKQDIAQYQRYLSYEEFYKSSDDKRNLMFEMPITVDHKSLLLYKESVFHRYPVDRQFYVDYISRCNESY